MPMMPFNPSPGLGVTQPNPAGPSLRVNTPTMPAAPVVGRKRKPRRAYNTSGMEESMGALADTLHAPKSAL